jgi:hypothetical protein
VIQDPNVPVQPDHFLIPDIYKTTLPTRAAADIKRGEKVVFEEDLGDIFSDFY